MNKVNSRFMLFKKSTMLKNTQKKTKLFIYLFWHTCNVSLLKNRS